MCFSQMTTDRVVAMCAAKCGEIQKELFKYLASHEARDEAANWKASDIYKEEAGDTWIIIDQNLERCLEEKITNMLQNWENDRRLFHTARRDILAECTKAYKMYFAHLKSIEQRLGTSEEPDFQMESWNYDPSQDATPDKKDTESQDIDPKINELKPPFSANIDWMKVMPQRDPDGPMGSFAGKISILLLVNHDKSPTCHHPYWRNSTRECKNN